MVLTRFAPGVIAAAILFGAAISGDGVQAAGETVLVNTAADTTSACATTGTGTCSLRDAITFANNNVGHDVIGFAVPGAGIRNIRPNSALPSLTDNQGTTIDGYTQGGSATNDLSTGTDAAIRIELDGLNAAGLTSGITIESNANIVKGLALINWGAAGVHVKSGFGNLITGNFAGMNASGVVAPNVRGIVVDTGVIATTIGGGAPADRNLISGNLTAGIQVQGLSTANTLISNNLIGTDYTGISALANLGPGVLIMDGASDTTVGGDVESANVIAFNTIGIAVQGGSIRNDFIGNSIHTNTQLGIDLGFDGITPNDEGDGDAGPNQVQNKPVLGLALVSSVTGQLVVKGEQDSNPFAGSNRLDIYLADGAVGAAGQGETWIGAEGGIGSGGFDFIMSPFDPFVAVSTGNILTATTTTNDGTSEFAANLAVVANAKPTASAGSTQNSLPKQVVTLNGAGSNDSDARPGTLTYQWTQISGVHVTLSSSTAQSPTFTPTQGGVYKFELVVNDGLDSSAVASVTVNVNDTTPPIATPQSVNAVGGETKSIRLAATDTESTTFIFKISSQPMMGSIISINESTGVVLYSPPTGYNGMDTFTFTASDGINTSSPATVTITVRAGVQITTGILPASVTGRPYKYALDADGGNGGYSWVFTGGIVPPGLTFGPDGMLTGIPTTAGLYQFGVEVTDGSGLKAQRQVIVTITDGALRPYRIFTFQAASDQ